jgi:hypothetical protein
MCPTMTASTRRMQGRRNGLLRGTAQRLGAPCPEFKWDRDNIVLGHTLSPSLKRRSKDRPVIGTIKILGREKTMKRAKQALRYLESMVEETTAHR